MIVHLLVIGDEMRFRTESGSIIRFGRQPGEQEFQPCMEEEDRWRRAR